MSRADKWDVHIDGILPTKKVCGFTIEWSGNIGFGEYIVYQEDGKWKGYSECMDEGEDKEFLRYLLDKFVENIEIAG